MSYPIILARNLTKNPQNRVFCAFLAFGAPFFGHFEHKIGIFVRFLPSEPSFSGILSTKSGFLCAFCLRDPHFRAFRARNRGFCAFLGFETLIFGKRLRDYVTFRAQNRGCCALVIETLASVNRKARKFFVFARF